MRVSILCLVFVSIVVASPAAAPAPTPAANQQAPLEPRSTPSPPSQPPISLNKRTASGSWTEPDSYGRLEFGQVWQVIGWSFGRQFIDRVAQIPTALWAVPPTDAPVPDSITAVLLRAGSANPADLPVGGTGFFAEPLSLTEATSVTLAYSVFFPLNFNFVHGGKLPGLFGGHPGCTGGQSAQNCFSTRMRWQAEGLGELYVYAPKETYTDPTLCATPPTTVCHNEPYGISVGRGAFTFETGAWTKIEQVITLNTPGGYDGAFTSVCLLPRPDTHSINVNDAPVIQGTTMYWRGPAPAVAKRDQIVVAAPHQRRDAPPSTVSFVTAMPPPAAARANSTHERRQHVPDRVDPVGFLGISCVDETLSLDAPSFEVFFGGDRPTYRVSTPVDQTIYFKDFSLTINE